MASIDRITFHEYQKAFFSGFKTEVFLHGPALRTDSESLILDWVGRLPLDENTPDVEITTGFWPGERSRSYWYEHPDQAAAVLYVDRNTGPGSRILNQLAGNLIEAPFYTRLRTEKQLGYITFASAFPLFNTPVLAGAVQSPTVNPDDLALAIEAEFRGFADMVESMPLEQFESQRLSLLDRVMNPPSTQSRIIQRYLECYRVKETIQRSDDAGSDTGGAHERPVYRLSQTAYPRSNSLKSVSCR